MNRPHRKEVMTFLFALGRIVRPIPRYVYVADSVRCRSGCKHSCHQAWSGPVPSSGPESFKPQVAFRFQTVQVLLHLHALFAGRLHLSGKNITVATGDTHRSVLYRNAARCDADLRIGLKIRCVDLHDPLPDKISATSDAVINCALIVPPVSKYFSRITHLPFILALPVLLKSAS